jgi:Sulfotransferase domain
MPHTPAQEALFARLEHFSTVEGRAAGLAVVPLPTDVYITTYPKSGTTWMQQIVQQLRSGAPDASEVDYKEITEAVPWQEMCVDLGLAVDASLLQNISGHGTAPPELATSLSSATRWTARSLSSASSRAGCSSLVS